MEAPLMRWVVLRGPAKLERNALNLRAEGLNLGSLIANNSRSVGRNLHVSV